jgi:hypothetical protein
MASPFISLTSNDAGGNIVLIDISKPLQGITKQAGIN